MESSHLLISFSIMINLRYKTIEGQIQTIPFPLIIGLYSQVSLWLKTMLNIIPGEVEDDSEIAIIQSSTTNNSILKVNDQKN